ncbi:MAG: hypothetical protein R3E54_17540 [Halioglobus sp.]
MKKAVLVGVAVALLVIAAGLVFREPLFNAVANVITADKCVDADSDSFNPGLPVGASLPEARVLYQCAEITALNAASQG